MEKLEGKDFREDVLTTDWKDLQARVNSLGKIFDSAVFNNPDTLPKNAKNVVKSARQWAQNTNPNYPKVKTESLLSEEEKEALLENSEKDAIQAIQMLALVREHIACIASIVADAENKRCFEAYLNFDGHQAVKIANGMSLLASEIILKVLEDATGQKGFVYNSEYWLSDVDRMSIDNIYFTMIMRLINAAKEKGMIRPNSPITADNLYQRKKVK